MKNAQQLKTVRDVLRYAMTRFGGAKLTFGHGSQNAWDEAVYLVLHHLHLPIDQLDPFLDARLLSTELSSLLKLIEARAKGTPAAYLTGEAWLGEYRFYVDERSIIPRSLIAELLFEGLAPWVNEPLDVTRVLDLCTGSGCLAIIAADVFPNARVDAVDISKDALEVATRNVAEYELNERVQLIESDLFAVLGSERYDLILCNPPYVNAASMALLPAEYLREPQLALSGGSDGMDLVRRILAQAPKHLSKNREAALILEIGHEQDHFDEAFPTLQYTALTTSAGDEQVLHIAAGALKKKASK